MTAPRDPDARVAAFFEAIQPDLPDRAFDAVRRDIQRTRQRVVVGPWRQPGALRDARYLAAAAVVVALAFGLLSLRPAGGPGGVPTPAPSPTGPAPSATVSPSAGASPAGPTVFTSTLYGYTVTVPGGWLTAPGVIRWDGIKQPGPDAETDKFVGPDQLMAWAFAGPFGGELASLVSDRIAANARDHADTCPGAVPEINEPLRIGGQPWVLLGWNCGALINQAVTIRAGVAYAFTFRDLGINAATNPVDRALFLSILDSIELPN
jgi:hypothetical protein